MGAKCLPIQSPSLPRKARRVRARESESGGRSRKSTPLRMPPGKIAQAQALLVQGRSQREIGRTLHMSPMTVAKIIKTEDFQGFIREQQERLFAIAPSALESFHTQVKLDGRLAYIFMKDLGIIPSREDLVTLKDPIPQDFRTGYNRVAWGVANMLIEGNKNFGIDIGVPAIKELIEGANREEETKKKA